MFVDLNYVETVKSIPHRLLCPMSQSFGVGVGWDVLVNTWIIHLLRTGSEQEEPLQLDFVGDKDRGHSGAFSGP